MENADLVKMMFQCFLSVYSDEIPIPDLRGQNERIDSETNSRLAEVWYEQDK